MKRRQRRTVLDVNGEDSSRRRWPNERQSHNGSPSNPLANLVGQYNSDSEVEDDNKPRSRVLNDQVDVFFKEIQSISHEDPKNNKSSSVAHPGSYWQECFDEQTGFPYYWHTETNQVTWEVPPELKTMQDKSQKDATVPHSANIPQWSNTPPSKYPQPQSNIPEGMIPKEVVVRNRNRQAGIVNKPARPTDKAENSKSSSFKKDDLDYGKIEMITSFGNEESESDESEREEPAKKPSCLKKPLSKSEKPSTSHNLDPREPRPPVGPSPPPVHFGPRNKEKLSEKLSQNLQNNKSANSESKNEEDILMRLKNQAKLLQFRGNANSPSLSKDARSTTPPLTMAAPESQQKSKKDLKLSLVPGYEDDSDGEDEASSSRRPAARPLFPIAEQPAASEAQSSRNDKKQETIAGSIRVYDYRNADATSESKSENDGVDSQSNVEDKPEDGRSDLESKTNKFLESIDAPTKAFQRKRRIAFDVAPNKSKDQDSNGQKDESISTTPVQVSSTDPSERRGLGFPKNDARGSPELGEASSKTESEASTTTNKKTGSIAFVKSTEESNSSTSSGNNNANSNPASKPREISETEKAELRQLTEPIMEKLRFLSEGSTAVSAVQVMAIQIQTLMCAWEAGVLQKTYLRNWLVGTASELTRLEQTAAPPGWECQWDRSHKRYYYRHASTGEAQWTYPQPDIAGGTEEMELCTTPPPPEQEETPIIEMSAQAAQQETKQQSSDPAPPPPPPQISSPSPPPPPRIFAEDLKQRGRKRKNSPDSADQKDEDELKEPGKLAGAEPLPPGVDPPELAYTLPASALEAGVLYGAQQTNPIYAATLASAAAAAGIPLLSHHHPHTALMQGQLVHYNPAYHQHLHNQALVAARLSGQEAVQFMVAAEYARVYENNQVIAKPPVKVTQESTLGSALNSFYSDIASIESTAADGAEKERLEALQLAPSPGPQVPLTEADVAALEAMREKKKKKIKTGISKKQKEMSSMVAKWQRAQKNYKD